MIWQWPREEDLFGTVAVSENLNASTINEDVFPVAAERCLGRLAQLRCRRRHSDDPDAGTGAPGSDRALESEAAAGVPRPSVMGIHPLEDSVPGHCAFLARKGGAN